MIDCPSRLAWFGGGMLSTALVVLVIAGLARAMNGLPADPTEARIRRPGEGGLL